MAERSSRLWSLAAAASIPLAPLDDADKAFLYRQSGVVLGIDIDAKNKRWRIPQDKAESHMRALQKVIQGNYATLNNLEVALKMSIPQDENIPLKLNFLKLTNSLKENSSAKIFVRIQYPKLRKMKNNSTSNIF